MTIHFMEWKKGCFIVKDRHDKIERYPLFEKEIDEVIFKSSIT